MLRSTSRPLVIAHRGATRRFPENTVAAVRDAAAMGADGVEVDLQRCQSGEVVVFHDFDLVAFGRKERVDGQTLPELRRLDLGHGERVPTLDELLDAAGGLVVHLELKHHDLRDAGLEAGVARVLARRTAEERTRVWLSSFNPMSLWRAGRLMPELPSGLLFHEGQSLAWRRTWPIVLPWVARRFGALHAQHRLVTPELVAYARLRGFRVHTWTVDSESDLRRVATLGVDAIITNQPLRALALLAKSNAEDV